VANCSSEVRRKVESKKPSAAKLSHMRLPKPISLKETAKQLNPRRRPSHSCLAARRHRLNPIRIQRVIESGIVKPIVIGPIDAAQLAHLQGLVSLESVRDIVLDLLKVTLVDSEVVRFLVQCERHGLRCPAYHREWMGRVSG
jgi:hypothetical protein